MPATYRALSFLIAVFFVPSAHSQNSAENLISRLESANEAQIQSFLPRFPAADRDGDGTLSREEALAFAKLLNRKSHIRLKINGMVR